MLATTRLLLAPLLLSGLDLIVDTILSLLTFNELARIYPLLCSELQAKNAKKPRLTISVLEKSLTNWNNWYFRQALNWPKKWLEPEQARRLLSALNKDSLFLLRIQADFRRYFMDPFRSALTSFGSKKNNAANPPIKTYYPDVRFSMICRNWMAPIADMSSNPADVGCCQGFVSVLSVKINPVRQVLAVVMSTSDSGKQVGIYAFGDGPERSNYGHTIYNYQPELVCSAAAILKTRDPTAESVLCTSWSPDGNILAVIECNHRLSLSSKIQFFVFLQNGQFKMLDFAQARLPSFGIVAHPIGGEVSDHNLWLGPSQYLLPTLTEPVKISFSWPQDNGSRVSAVLSPFETSVSPSKLFDNKTHFYGNCYLNHSVNSVHCSVTGYQPALYCLTRNGQFLVAVEHCPVKNHFPHSGLSFVNMKSGQKGALIFKGWFVQDVTPLTESQNSLLVLLTRIYRCPKLARAKKAKLSGDVDVDNDDDDDDDDDRDSGAESDNAAKKIKKEEKKLLFKKSTIYLRNLEKDGKFVPKRPTDCGWGIVDEQDSLEDNFRRVPSQRDNCHLQFRLVKIAFGPKLCKPKIVTLSTCLSGRLEPGPPLDATAWLHHRATLPHIAIAAQTKTLVLVKINSCQPGKRARVGAISKIFNGFEDVTTEGGYAIPSPDLKIIARDCALFSGLRQCRAIAANSTIEMWKCFEAGHDSSELAADRQKTETAMLRFSQPLRPLLVHEHL